MWGTAAAACLLALAIAGAITFDWVAWRHRWDSSRFDHAYQKNVAARSKHWAP